jgi:hypothetical protein
MTSRLQQCIDALKAEKVSLPHDNPDFNVSGENFNRGIDKAIAIITRILSANLTHRELEDALVAYVKFSEEPAWESGMQAALLTAFPQPPKGE